MYSMESLDNMDRNNTLSPHQIQTISYVYIAFLIPSLIGSFSVLVVSLLRWRNLQEQRLVLVQLALADFLASAFLMCTSLTNVVFTKENADLCMYGLLLALVFYVLSFSLVSMYAWKSKNAFQGWRTSPIDSEEAQSVLRTKEKVLYFLVWFLHIGGYMLYVLTWEIYKFETTQIKNIEPPWCNSCFLFSHTLKDSCSGSAFNHHALVYLFAFFMAAEGIVSCTVIYHDISKWYNGQKQQTLFPVEGDGQSSKRLKHVLPTARNMILVIIFCWTPALLLFILTFTTHQANLFPLYIIQAATVSLQGFLNCMVYAWRRPNFTEAVLGEHTPLIPYHHVSFFEESLKTTV